MDITIIINDLKFLNDIIKSPQIAGQRDCIIQVKIPSNLVKIRLDKGNSLFSKKMTVENLDDGMSLVTLPEVYSYILSDAFILLDEAEIRLAISQIMQVNPPEINLIISKDVNYLMEA